MDVRNQIKLISEKAQRAAREFVFATREQKNTALQEIANDLVKHSRDIQFQNGIDLQAGRESGLSAALLDRLTLNDKRIVAMVQSIRDVAALPDPVGEVLRSWTTAQGLSLRKVRVPIGVIGIIYESRPNVTAEAAALCLKTGNAVILRGGKEAICSNMIIAEIIQKAISRCSLPEQAIQLISTTDREAIVYLVQMEGLVDLVIPRGGEALIRAVMEHARVPVIKHYKGVCHLFVDSSADFGLALRVIENSKCQRPGVCNALEKLLISRDIAADFLPQVAELLQKKGVELRGDQESCKIIPGIKMALEQDWSEEYLDLILTVGVVGGIEEAIHHINHYGSHHTDGIIAADRIQQQQFELAVDSAVIFINTSTRFTDGNRFGMGTEMGISTDKIHARGPMALEELTTYKYIGQSDGAIVQE